MRFRFALIALSAVVSVSVVSAQNVRTRFTKKVNLGGDTIGWFAVPLNNGGYAVLCTVNRAGRVDGVLSAYAANGATLWNQTVWSSYDFRPNGLLKTSNGDLIIVARARNQTEAFAYTARISSNGGTVWAHARQYGVGGGAYAGTIDQNDNIYITGSGKFNGFENAFAVKMNGAGTEVYQKYFPGSLPDFFQGDKIAVNNAGEAIIDIDSDIGRLWRLDATGNTRWAKAFINHIGPSDFLLDNSGNLYVAGSNRNAIDDACPAVQKINAAGALQWTRLFNFEGAEFDGMTQLKFDTAGNLIAGGHVRYLSNNQDFFQTKISQAGAVSYTRLFNSFGTAIDTLLNLHLDGRNQSYLVGSRQGTPDGSWTVKADANAMMAWNMITPTSGTAITIQTSALSPVTGDLAICGHDAITASLVLYSYSQAAFGVSNSYTVPKNSTYNSPTSVLANDYYAADATAAQVAAPAHGTLTLNANGTFVYKPTTNYTGPDSFTYRALKTGLSPSATVTVSLTVQ